MLARAITHAVIGLHAQRVEVEAHIRGQQPSFAIVGLADRAVQEAKERVRSAVRCAELRWPDGRVIVNLAPAELRKEGSAFDLPIALTILAAGGVVPRERLAEHVSIGELALDGRVRRVGGVLAVADAARRAGVSTLLCPADAAAEAALTRLVVIPVRHLGEAVRYLRGESELEPYVAVNGRAAVPSRVDLADVRGQARGRRALEIAAAGGHNLLFEGPPGTGKTMLARRLPTILPPLDDEDALEVTRIHSIAGLLDPDHPLIVTPPFRSPHHSASTAAIVGGGPRLRPGEASLAHRGVLFLDELAEFQRPVLEALRQPLEDGVLTIARAAGNVRFPARFQLVGARNLCPCGARGDPKANCTCSPQRLVSYRAKLSRALLDRFDLVVPMPRPRASELAAAPGETSIIVRERVESARERLRTEQLRRDPPADATLTRAVERVPLSGRGRARVARVARTIAALADASTVCTEHVAEALTYRARFELDT